MCCSLTESVCSSRPDRLRDIADRFNVDHDAVLDNVLYARAYTSQNIRFFFHPAQISSLYICVFQAKACFLLNPAGEHQMELLDMVAAKFHEEGGVFKLLVRAKNSAQYLIKFLLIFE